MAQAPLFRKQKFKRKPGFIRESEAEYYRRTKKTYNQRIEREVKRWQKIDKQATYETLVRQGLVQPKMQRGIGDYKTRKQFFASVKAMESTGTAKFKAGQLEKMRTRMAEVVKAAYGPEEEVAELIEQIVRHMSDKDIFKFSMDNPQVIADYYEKYKANNEQGIVDAEQYINEMSDLLNALEPYAAQAGLEEELAAVIRDYDVRIINQALVRTW